MKLSELIEPFFFWGKKNKTQKCVDQTGMKQKSFCGSLPADCCWISFINIHNPLKSSL